jgi:hypothetical protein
VNLSDGLAEGLAGGPPPGTGPGVVRYAGGRLEAVRALSGMSGPPARKEFADAADYKRASMTWRSASRRVQRWEAPEGKQQRGRQKVRIDGGERERLIDRGVSRRMGRWRKGARCRVHARVVVRSPKAKGPTGPDARDRTMPSGGPGVFIGPDELAEILDEFGDDEVASADLFREAFLESYGVDADMEFEVVYSITIWPAGTAEP